MTNVAAAKQLVQIADKMSMLTNSANGMTAEDSASLSEAALGVLGITQDQVTAAYIAYGNGDKSAVNNLVVQGAGTLGMSANDLRTQILPQLGLNLGQ